MTSLDRVTQHAHWVTRRSGGEHFSCRGNQAKGQASIRVQHASDSPHIPSSQDIDSSHWWTILTYGDKLSGQKGGSRPIVF